MEARHPTLDDMITSILAQLGLKSSSALNAQQQKLVAEHLLTQTKALDLNIATTLLFRATHHALFQDDDSRDLIASAFEQINYERLPQHSTVESIKRHENTHAQAVADLLNKPVLLLAWLEQATALEIGKLFDNYFHPRGNNFLNMRELAELECSNGRPGKALLCHTLMLTTFPGKEGIPYIEQAIAELSQFKRSAKSACIKIYAAHHMIEKSKGCFINLNRINLDGMDYTGFDMSGAFINRTSLCRVNLTRSCLFQTRLNDSILTSAILSHANLKFAKLCGAKLHDVTLEYADLYEADLSNADLTRANLCRTNLQSTNFTNTTLNGVTFLIGSDLQHTDSLKAELDRLEKMLAGHKFLDVLQDAIANDLINNSRSTVSQDLIKPLLETALTHPLFTQHQHYHYLKETANVMTSLYNAASTRLFNLVGNTEGKIEEAKPAHETNAQKVLREELARQTKSVNKLGGRHQRPLPPRQPPSAPQFK
jgi:uncharacterized protein YjbI with pentapeptide repeats